MRRLQGREDCFGARDHCLRMKSGLCMMNIGTFKIEESILKQEEGKTSMPKEIALIVK